MTTTTNPHLQVDDFSGGITDNHVAAPTNKCEKADNFLLESHSGKGKFLVRPGSNLYDSDYPRVKGVSSRINWHKIVDDVLYAQTDDEFYYLDAASGWLELTGPSGNDAFPSGFDETNYVSVAEWEGHLLVCSDYQEKPLKIYPNASGTPVLRTASLPALSSSPSPTGGGSGSNYVYLFFHSYSYNVNTVTFLDQGPVDLVSVTNISAPNASNVSIGGFTTPSNGTDYNWDTSNIETQIYRTEADGDAFYYVGKIDAAGDWERADGTTGSTPFVDNISDANLITYTPLATSYGQAIPKEGVVLDNDEAPQAKYVHVVNDIAYYGAILEGGEYRERRVRQSLPKKPFGAPAQFNIDGFDSDIKGVSSIRGTPVVICEVGAFRIEGRFNGDGTSEPSIVKISDTSTCVNNASIVQTLEGIFWCGTDGFYFCNGYDVIKVNEEWSDTHSGFTDTAEKRSRVYGAYDNENRRVYWSVQEGVTDVDKCYVLDLEYGVKPDSTFTSISGGTSFAPTSISFDRGDLVRADRRGYILKHSDTVYDDPKVDTTVTPSSWTRTPIIYEYRSASMDFGTAFVRKYVVSLVMTLKNVTNASVLIKSNNDDYKKVADLKPIRFRGNLVWGDPTPVWGDESLIWDFDGLIEVQRRFPSKGLRCTYKQIQITNAFVAIYSSESQGTADIDSINKTVTLNTVTTEWASDIVDYYIAFASDSYVNEYLITSRDSASQLTFSDGSNLVSSDASASGWVIRGYPKNERISLLSYSLNYSPMSYTQDAFRQSGTGEVGAGLD